MAYAHRQVQVPTVCRRSAITYPNSHSDIDCNGDGRTDGNADSYRNSNSRRDTRTYYHPNASSSLFEFSYPRPD